MRRPDDTMQRRQRDGPSRRRRHHQHHCHGRSSSSSHPRRRRITAPPPPLVVVLAAAMMAVACTVHRADAVLPTAAIDAYYTTASGAPVKQTLLASQASFGSYPAMGAGANKDLFPALPPQDDTLLCGDHYDPNGKPDPGKGGGDTVMLVPRGTCTFEKKARNAQRLGASAIVIYGTLESRYSYNATSSSTVWPLDKNDYDCDYGSAYISTETLKVDPYVGNVDDAQLTGTSAEGNLCARAVGDGFENTCGSKRCLLTGKTMQSHTVNAADIAAAALEENNEGGGDDNNKRNQLMQACCAWDLHLWLYSDESMEKEEKDAGQEVELTIQALFVTMEQGATILDMYQSAADAGTLLHVVPYARPRPTYNPSAVLIWALGVFVAGLASYLSAQQYRVGKTTSDDGEQGEYQELTTTDESTQPLHSPRGGDEGSSPGSAPPSPVRAASAASSSAAHHPPPARQDSEETLELTWHHAVLFLLFSSCALFILFFFKIYNLVKIMYGIGCSGAVSQIVFIPLYTKLSQKLCYSKTQPHHHRDVVLFTLAGEPITLIDTLAVMSGYGLGIAWIVVGFRYRDPSSLPFFWITQNVMGASMCIVFLSLIRLNSIKVATILLIAAFVYDIFFVFITPLIFESSVMITVATSGGPPTKDPTWCEKYPKDDGCQGGDPLPMLFTIPRIGDYQGGASLLGLGDVVLPGLLLSFACRFDAAKRLVGLNSDGRGVKSCCGSDGGNVAACMFGGYFCPTLVAYGVGLMMANLAVYLMNMGQPALLYLVPMCLGTMCALGAWRGEMGELWRGPRVLASADRILALRSNPQHPQHCEVQSGDDGSVSSAGGGVVKDDSSVTGASPGTPLAEMT